jgi:hypothetical protein
MSEFQCIITDKRACKPPLQRDLVFIIGSGDSEFEDDLKAIKEVLEEFGLKGNFALLNSEEKGFDAFCNKICSKILSSIFCVVMLNDPIDKFTKEEKQHRAPRANVYYEFGIAVGLKKRVLPVMRKGMDLPFDVQHIDVDIYASLEDLKEKLRASVKSTLLKPVKEITKEPNLELSLLDSEKNPVETMMVSPTFTIVKKEKTMSPLSKESDGLWFAKALPGLYGLSKKPSADLVPLRISITNTGGRKAEGIRIFLYFPPECKLIPKDEFSNAFLLPVNKNPTSGGLNVKDQLEARAWVDVLGNDLTMDEFDEVYVKFPKEGKYEIKASVTQHNYPTKNFRFLILVKPKYEQKTEYIYEPPEPEDIDSAVLEKRIKELGKKEKEELK